MMETERVVRVLIAVWVVWAVCAQIEANDQIDAAVVKAKQRQRQAGQRRSLHRERKENLQQCLIAEAVAVESWSQQQEQLDQALARGPDTALAQCQCEKVHWRNQKPETRLVKIGAGFCTARKDACQHRRSRGRH